jgi:hypothetical protein
MFTPRRSLTSIAALGLAFLLGACDDSSVTAPEPSFDDASAGPVGATGIDRISEQAATRALRLEIEVGLDGPPWIAEEVETEDDAERTEKIEARIRSIDPAARRIELTFGGLVVDVSAGARLESAGSRELSWDEFVRRVESALAAGEYPGAEMYRPLSATPQAPTNAAFTAVKIELEDDVDDIELELLVDERHFQLGANGTGTITVLGVDIAVDPSSGTEVWDRDDDWDETFDVEAFVSAVDLASGVVTLVDGRTFRVVAGTRFEDDDDDYLGSLREVADALADGHWVEVDADLRIAQDGSWVAVEVEFYKEDDADDLPDTREFDEYVTAVDLGASSFTLEDGRTFFVTADTRIDDDGDLRSLAEVAEALEAGFEVEADGYFVVDANAPGGTRLLEVEFDREDDDGDDDGDDGESIDFDGEVIAVDMAAGTFTLEDGVVYFVAADTRFDDDGDLFSLAEMAEALSEGLILEVDGEAVVDDTVPGGLRVLDLEVEIYD